MVPILRTMVFSENSVHNESRGHSWGDAAFLDVKWPAGLH